MRDNNIVEISQEGIDRLIGDMYKLVLPPGDKIIHVIPQEYAVDNEQGILDPIGMSGVRLEANFHIITGQIAASNNLYRCVEKSGLRVANMTLEPIASAMSVLNEEEREAGVALVDIGGGTTEIAIISLGGIVESRSLRIAGDEFDECIINYMRRTYNLMIGPRTAEEIKINIGSAYPLGDNELEMEVRGRDQVAGLPITKRINSVEIRECLAEPIQQIVESVKLTLEKCPPELAADLVERGMVLAGGGALIKGLDKALIKETGLPVIVAPNPLLAVCLGTGKALEYLDKFKKRKSVAI
jgi:MreB/Mrl family cell shape determining protein